MDQLDGWTRYADFYRASPYAAFPQEHRNSPGRLPFQMIKVDLNDYEFVDPSLPETVLALPLSASSGNAWSWDMGEGWRQEAAMPGRMLVLPADNASRWKFVGSRQVLALAIPSRTMRQVLGSSAPCDLTDAFRPLAQQTWEDDFVQALMMRLWEGAQGGHATDRLLVDGGLVTLVSHLAQRADSALRPVKYVALPQWRLKRVIDFVDAHLHEEIDLVALAHTAGLSVRHFARTFREQMGETPHRWVMDRRMARAMALIKRNDMPLPDVAESCGFSGQSHFTKVFKQLTGTTPRRWFHQQKSEAH